MARKCKCALLTAPLNRILLTENLTQSVIDGEALAQLMIDHNVGVSTIATYELKKIDSDYFMEE
mgnify:CR=1 FL=1